MSSNPFDYVNAISHSKKNIIAESDDPVIAEKEYVPFIVNRGLSYFSDCILYANELNCYPSLDNRLQFECLLNMNIRPRKRFAKWFKVDDETDIQLVQEVYQCNKTVAMQYLKLLPPSELISLRDSQVTGGLQNGKRKTN